MNCSEIMCHIQQSVFMTRLCNYIITIAFFIRCKLRQVYRLMVNINIGLSMDKKTFITLAKDGKATLGRTIDKKTFKLSRRLVK